MAARDGPPAFGYDCAMPQQTSFDSPPGFLRLPPSAPQVKATWRRWLGILLMKISGWRVAGTMPADPRFVMIVAPHTSNWDFFHGFTAYLTLQLDTTWMAKHTVFFWPLGLLARRFGGMPIRTSTGWRDRSSRPPGTGNTSRCGRTSGPGRSSATRLPASELPGRLYSL